MKIKLLLFLLLAPFVYSQTQGVVVNNENNNPIPYTNIWIKDKNTGTSADENGVFLLQNTKKEDTLVFSAIGYKTRYIAVNELTQTINLKQESVMLDEVLIRSAIGKKENHVQPFRKRHVRFELPSSGNPQIHAIFFPYSAQYDETPFLKAVQVYTKTQKNNAKFILRFYSVDNEGNPSSDLLRENIIVTSKSGSRITEIDVSEYNLKIPFSGFFVAIERLIVDENKYTQKITRDNKTTAITLFEPSFGILLTENNDESFMYEGGRWFRPLERHTITRTGIGRNIESRYIPAISIILSN